MDLLLFLVHNVYEEVFVIPKADAMGYFSKGIVLNQRVLMSFVVVGRRRGLG